MIERCCRNCGEPFRQFNKLQTKCGKCSYNLHAKPRKPMKRLGKVGKQWLADRAEWVTNNPPDHQGYWACYLQISPQCLGRMDLDQLNVEHMARRTRHPEQRRDQSYLRPACGPCNELKGSKDLEEIR